MCEEQLTQWCPCREGWKQFRVAADVASRISATGWHESYVWGDIPPQIEPTAPSPPREREGMELELFEAAK